MQLTGKIVGVIYLICQAFLVRPERLSETGLGASLLLGIMRTFRILCLVCMAMLFLFAADGISSVPRAVFFACKIACSISCLVRTGHGCALYWVGTGSSMSASARFAGRYVACKGSLLSLLLHAMEPSGLANAGVLNWPMLLAHLAILNKSLFMVASAICLL